MVAQFLGDRDIQTLNLEELWRMMDTVWDEIGCDNLFYDPEKYSAFYSHPVWLVNGLFIEKDETSLSHRKSIARSIKMLHPSSGLVLDFGGGFGTLARCISRAQPDLKIHVYEQRPFESALRQIDDERNIEFISTEIIETYDIIVSTDVFEHVFEPLVLLQSLARKVRQGGYFIVGNNFTPVIKCHLPCTFHLRYSFSWLMLAMGFLYLGRCPGSYPVVYRKLFRSRPWLVPTIEAISKMLFDQARESS